MKKRALALLFSLLTLAGAFASAFVVSAKWVGTYDAMQWWNYTTSTAQLFAYYSNGNIINTPAPVNKAAFVTRSYDIDPYVSWTSINSRYISTTWAGLENTFQPLPSGATMYGIQLQFRDQWTLIQGRTYEFVILRNSIAFYNSAGEPVSTGTQVSTVSFGGLIATLEDKYIGQDGYDRAIRCTVTPTADVQVQTISIVLKSNYNPSTSASKLILNLAFSDVVSYTGDLQDVVVNPTIDNIDKQVQEIQKSLNPDVDYSKLDEAIAEAGGIDGYLKAQQDDIMSSADRFKIKKPSGVLPVTGDIPSFLWALVNGITNLQIPVSNVTTSYFNGVTIPGLIVISAGGSYLSIGGMLTICAAIYGVRVFLHLVGARTFTSKASDQEGDK